MAKIGVIGERNLGWSDRKRRVERMPQGMENKIPSTTQICVALPYFVSDCFDVG